jgi:acetyl/propionyl-CoA carboxylase alpha subunit
VIRTLLIANRGEVAGRIISTCGKIGIRTVAVYSEADKESLHVRLADEAICIGPAEPSKSYLNIVAILDAAKRCGADAIHPGYGFLAENAEFARSVEQAGLTFIGPRPDVIEQMGSKVTARALCEKSGVPTVPGSKALDDEGLVAWADNHSYPVMLKASAGGGGKGMRRLANRESLEAAIPSARREAEKAFGSDQLYLERAIQQPRHLEVQIIGDTHGNQLHLGVRECSLQRRHQKIVEESPPSRVSKTLITSLTDAAVRLAREVNYTSLGTVEFLVEGDSFYFLEMNTRLQVEHPVTEMVTGLDLVELQLELAQGEKLAFTQDQVQSQGHAVEARISCEDPYSGFLPDTGRVLDWRTCSTARYDACLEPGTMVTPYYDSMVAKVICWGETRPKALRSLEAALQRTVLLGVKHNIDFLRFLLRHPAVEAGEQHTELVENLDLVRPEIPSHQLLAAAALRWLSLAGRQTSQLTTLPTEVSFAGQPSVTISQTLYTIDDTEHTVEIAPGALIVDGHRFPVFGAADENNWWVHTPQGTVCLQGVPRLPVPSAQGSAGGTLQAPMPGSIVEILVSEGDRVSGGQTLMKMEAMKMEQVISSPHDGIVEKLLFKVGDQVEAGAKLLVVTESESL